MRGAIVLGAGMVGVATAVHLQRHGWSVALIDRGEPGRETSYGNAGIIQSEALQPYGMPHHWRDLARITAGRSNDVRYRLPALRFHLRPPSLLVALVPLPSRSSFAAYAQIIARAPQSRRS
ncbi:FAD-dependent oxidoreductase [Bradyrhizobium sp. WSM1743]|uniref:FAD-dependent oxidoreductase n=1 Tax=Bradyrhizobium sp. WSM1743 TaxID=318996 RepID=UPI000484B62A|nr:FAD-dependent oxidoreductase [Bradyrhizobium sp. WSM1743]